MIWIDIPTYFGPDRRRRAEAAPRDRRRQDCLREYPSLVALLRELQVRVLDALDDDVALARCCARVDTVAAYARSVGETGAALWLETLSRTLKVEIGINAAPTRLGELIAAHAQSALATLPGKADAS